jgi:hypothetical protein
MADAPSPGEALEVVKLITNLLIPLVVVQRFAASTSCTVLRSAMYILST